MLDFHSEIPAQVVISGVMGPLSRKAPLQLIAALAAVADEGNAQFESPTLRSAIRVYAERSRDRSVPLELTLARLTGLVAEVAPEIVGTEKGRMLLANLHHWAAMGYDWKDRS